MAVSKKNFFKDHYDWLVALAGLVLLAGVVFLFITSDNLTEDAARSACEIELKQRTPAHKNVPSADFTVLDKVRNAMAKPSLLQVPSDKEGNFLASECRVYCKNPDVAACHKPIPFKSKECPYCGFVQPSEDSAEAVRGGIDADNDGMPDAWELKFGLNPNDPADAKADPDGDTFTNLEEFQAKSDPKNSESHPDFLDFLTLASELRTDKLPFWFKMANPIRNGYRLTFAVTAKEYHGTTSAVEGEEIEFQLVKAKYVKGRRQDDKVKSGWRVLKYNKKEKRVVKPGTEQKVTVDVSTVDLERVSDKRVISVKIGVNPISVEEQMDLQWDRGEGKKLTVAKGSEFALGNRKYKVKSLKKGHVTIVDLKSNTEKTIGDGASEPKSAAKPAPNPKPSPKR